MRVENIVQKPVRTIKQVLALTNNAFPVYTTNKSDRIHKNVTLRSQYMREHKKSYR